MRRTASRRVLSCALLTLHLTPTDALVGVFTDSAGLRAAVNEWVGDATAAESNHGHVSGWDVSRVDDFTKLFAGWDQPCMRAAQAAGKTGKGCPFNDDISAWDTSSVTSMFATFYWADSFNQPVGGWDTSKVNIMHGTFSVHGRAYEFFDDLSNWDTANVEVFFHMFYKAYGFNHPRNISTWDVSKASDMTNMFRYTALESDI